VFYIISVFYLNRSHSSFFRFFFPILFLKNKIEKAKFQKDEQQRDGAAARTRKEATKIIYKDLLMLYNDGWIANGSELEAAAKPTVKLAIFFELLELDQPVSSSP
jgi:hypothetical protein